MTPKERADTDHACLTLLGWTDLEWDGRSNWRGKPPEGEYRFHSPRPTSDPALVVPIAEALHDRGFLVRMFQTTTEGKRWSVSIVGKDDFGFLVAEESGDSLPVCLALAAARAVGTETKDA